MARPCPFFVWKTRPKKAGKFFVAHWVLFSGILADWHRQAERGSFFAGEFCGENGFFRGKWGTDGEKNYRHSTAV